MCQIKHMKYVCLALLSATLFCSCEGETTWIKQIDNQSNFDVTVSYYDSYSSEDASKVVDAHTTEIIFYGEKRGGDDTPLDCLEYLDDLEVVLDSGAVLTKDINDSGNWEREISEKNLGGVVNQTCRFSIENDDFE